MWLSERLLFLLARRFYRTEVCHSEPMKTGLKSLDAYDRYRAERGAAIVEHARRFGVDFAERTVLDFGCADGAITPHYLKTGAARVIGVDLDAKAIARAQTKNDEPRVSFLQSSVEGVPLDDESLDVVVSYDVFEHVTRPAPILAELHRVLRPGGQVLIGTWGWYHPFAPHLFATM